ncbi:hypothetical protein FRC20_007867 [Serendipita sp. 405]|nr:hypothetical protein FRC16_007475 [Serendipita sp. 398]KAG8832575.1 hypothetical protein FRC20_007867 [Serendipita sp. 405]
MFDIEYASLRPFQCIELNAPSSVLEHPHSKRGEALILSSKPTSLSNSNPESTGRSPPASGLVMLPPLTALTLAKLVVPDSIAPLRLLAVILYPVVPALSCSDRMSLRELSVYNSETA